MSYVKILILVLCLLEINSATAQIPDLEVTYQFLVSDRETLGGILYTATAGELQGDALPLSFFDSPEYWGAYVCKQLGACNVTDIYNPMTYTLTPQLNSAGILQTERVNTHSGTNIYDAATWQIAVVLGKVINQFGNPSKQDAYALANNQNKLLRLSYSGNAPAPVPYTNRATSNGDRFVYNHHIIANGEQAYAFRMIPRSWLSVDPFMGTQYQSLIATTGLPKQEPDYQLGKITWTDWKPITGENAWAFLLGPLHAAYIHFVKGEHYQYVPFDDLSVQNALAVLPTFAAMQSPIGAVYYAPAGTLANQANQLVNPHQVSVENNASLYAGLKVLDSTLRAELGYEKKLSEADKEKINAALRTIMVMIEGGQLGGNNQTAGLLSFFKTHAWRNNEFVQGGLANDPNEPNAWVPYLKPKAIDVNTWSIAALGAEQIDKWFGFGASYKNWQQVKTWGAYGVKNKLWGVGYSNDDGNGTNTDGAYRQGILSAEWTAGAINMVRSLINYYKHLPADSANFKKAQTYVQSLTEDETSMLEALQTLRIDNYEKTGFTGKPISYNGLIHPSSKAYLYASKRYFIPFGWYANPIPSTCATSWIVMLADRYDPFGYAGMPN